MWRIRLGRGLPRYLLGAAAVFGLAASARYAIAPPRASDDNGARATLAVDRAAEGYAVLFARRYLSWSAAQPQTSARGLEPFLGAGAESGAGLVLPPSGEQQVQWAEVVQMREPQPGVHVYTVAAQTDSAGLLYLSVGVERTAGGVELTGYPAFVGAPSASPAGSFPQHAREVQDAQLRTVVERALRNYLAGAGEELAADLTSAARVSLPGISLVLQSLQRLDWTEADIAVLAVVQARDERGTQYELAYELDVARQQGRWEISAVQMDPDS
jgi:hypothetical protein